MGQASHHYQLVAAGGQARTRKRGDDWPASSSVSPPIASPVSPDF